MIEWWKTIKALAYVEALNKEIIHMSEIILVDSSEYVRKRMANLLKKLVYDIVEIDSYSELLPRLMRNKDKIKLIIMDINVNGEDGLKAIEDMRSHEMALPIIISTSENSRETFLRGLRLGVQGYILKPFSDDFVLNRVIRTLSMGDETIKKNIEKASSLAFLSGDQEIDLSREYEKYIAGEYLRAKKGNYSVSFLNMDFKNSKEEYSGSQSLMLDYIYSYMQEKLWHTDTVLQYKNSNFIGIYPFCKKENVPILLEKIQKDFLDFVEKEPEFKQTSLDIDVVTYPEDGIKIEDLLSKIGLDDIKVKFK